MQARRKDGRADNDDDSGYHDTAWRRSRGDQYDGPFPIGDASASLHGDRTGRRTRAYADTSTAESLLSGHDGNAGVQDEQPLGLDAARPHRQRLSFSSTVAATTTARRVETRADLPHDRRPPIAANHGSSILAEAGSMASFGGDARERDQGPRAMDVHSSSRDGIGSDGRPATATTGVAVGDSGGRRREEGTWSAATSSSSGTLPPLDQELAELLER